MHFEKPLQKLSGLMISFKNLLFFSQVVSDSGSPVMLEMTGLTLVI